MMKIATHNSGTGEPSGTWKDKLLAPFARCQSKSILHQYKAGCRLFDIRVNSSGFLAHGLWQSKKDAFSALSELNTVADECTYVLLTVEGRYDEDLLKAFEKWRAVFNRLRFVAFCVKEPEWATLRTFEPLSWRKCFSSATWRKLIPIPRLWKGLSGDVGFDEDVFTMVDFL
jgi:hypothetical protein